MRGRIHSLESMGLRDGPGIRFVVFLQGCRLRCAYCHNPDTWDPRGGYVMEAKELLREIQKYTPYFAASGGGVTFSGGEPLLQPRFLLEMLALCREQGIHTAVDTAGIGLGGYEEILAQTDLVILDLKHVSSRGYRELTGVGKEELEPFLSALNNSASDIWIRHVVVPGITDSYQHIAQLNAQLKDIKNVKRVELLPYHSLGENKYAELGLKYRLSGVKQLKDDRLRVLTDLINFTESSPQSEVPENYTI